MMAYYRLGKYEDARASMKQLLKFARDFRMDNPLPGFGSKVYQPNKPYNICYDTFGPPAALIRGLFEYLYRADGVTLVPHIPPEITELEQRDPIRFGTKKLYLATIGSGPITAVRVNGQLWQQFDAASIYLPYDQTPATARVVIMLGGATYRELSPAEEVDTSVPTTATEAVASLTAQAAKLADFHEHLVGTGIGGSYQAAHAQLALDAIAAVHQRRQLLAEGKIDPLSESERQLAADELYVETATKICGGLEAVLTSYEESDGPDISAK